MLNTLKKSTNSVLILEDDPDLADSIRLFLEDTYRVYIIDDPSQLKPYIKKYGIKLLVTDLDMVYPNQENNLKLVKSFNPDIKIILMYMFLDDEKQKNHSILKEADDYIFKPFDADVFRYKIDRLLA
jgi:DNA-binding response OmpR family regulator